MEVQLEADTPDSQGGMPEPCTAEDTRAEIPPEALPVDPKPQTAEPVPTEARRGKQLEGTREQAPNWAPPTSQRAVQRRSEELPARAHG